MSRRLAGLIVFSGAVVTAWAAQTADIRIMNPSLKPRVDVPVVVPVGDTLAQALDKSMVLVGDEMLPVQFDDVNGDSTPDEMVFLSTLAPAETKGYSLRANTCGFAPPDRAHAGMYKKGFEGPGWESDQLAFRLYWDERNAIDIFGKRHPTLGLAAYARPGTNYHQDTPFGMDILKVGPALGAGGFGIWEGGAIRKVEKADREYSVLADGPIRCISDLIYRNWEVGERKFDLTARISMIAAQHYAAVELYVVPHDSEPAPEFVAGIVKHEDTTLIQDKKAGILGRWGLQALAPGEKPKGSNLGIGIVAAPDRIVEIGEDANNSYMRLRGENRALPGKRPAANQSYVRYRIHASWSLEPAGANSAAEYERMLRELLEPEPVVEIEMK